MTQTTLFETTELEESIYCPVCNSLGEITQAKSCFRYCNKCESKFGIVFS